MILSLLACTGAPGSLPEEAPPEPPLIPEESLAPLSLSLPVSLDVPLPCAPGCAREEQVRSAVSLGIDALQRASADPEIPINLDLLIGLAGVQRVFSSPRLDALREALLPRLDTGGDPRRRLWDPEHRMPPGYTPAWIPDPAREVSPNHLLIEALFCPEHGFREGVIDYTCQVFRDDGGLMSAHAAWGLSLAVSAGCVSRDGTCLDAVRDELVAAATGPVPLDTTLERDRHAEQLLFGVMAGGGAQPLAVAADRLLALQRSDGSLAQPPPGEDPWWGVHATLAAVWGWSAWLEARVAW